MRVIAGSRKGHPLKPVPGMKTRPTTDKVKESLFSMIGPYFDGGRALDLFAGTGGLGIEALSRGMERAVFCEKDGGGIRIIRENLAKTRFEECAEIIRGNALQILEQLIQRNDSFDLVFLDPPYDMKYYEPCLQRLLNSPVLTDEAVVVVESDPSKQDVTAFFQGWDHYKRAVYGSTCIDLLRRPSGEAEGR